MALNLEPREGEAEAPQDGYVVELVPSRITLEMLPSPSKQKGPPLEYPFHAPEPPQGVVVRIRSRVERDRVLRLSLVADEDALPLAWRTWHQPPRRATIAMGGGAIDAHDRIEDGGQTLTVLVRPFETREFRLEIRPPLAKAVYPCAIPFEIRATNVDDGNVVTRAGEVRISHGASRLLDLLPSIYREALHDPDEAPDRTAQPPFFERYLKGFEDGMAPLQRALGELDRLFGAFTCPDPFLLWLGAWVAIPQDERWPQMRRRRLIQKAVHLFQWRGTARGLRDHLEIYTGVVPLIDDQPVEGMRLGSTAILGHPKAVLGDNQVHTFTVTLALPHPEEIDLRVVNEIIRWNKPAHTDFKLQIVRPDPA